ncbi:MAG: pantothenate kinase [Bacteroidetes bacterium HGW-Bacteroidetes-1]|jgi:type III pantothenate kinase|nr:MAG: pantothenate kinase [Bacteroidetes bacterium HGW-Bacteroidetes-1]
MMLAIDIGNTLAKAALFDGNTLVESVSFETDKPELLFNLLASRKIPSTTLIAFVKTVPEVFIQKLSAITKVILLDCNTPLPFRIAYRTPETLGPDRIAAVAAAYNKFSDRNVLVIDMGTCITYDFLKDDGVYLGGAISPGINMRFAAMKQFTSKLPQVDILYPVSLIGQTTMESMQSGVMNGVQGEIDALIAQYEGIYKDLTVLIGGGDNNYFDKKFRINIFAVSNLVLEGLKVIMDFNEIR